MKENRTIHLAEIPIGGKGGFIWNRLHGEREDICEALLTRFEATSQTQQYQELLHARLRRIDDALDRLMSGSYGICSNCRRSIEDANLEVDAASALCMDCSEQESSTDRVNKNELSGDKSDTEIILERLNSFDTILLHTHPQQRLSHPGARSRNRSHKASAVKK